MAKSRIIELQQKPVVEDDRIKEETFWNGDFLVDIAENVNSDTDRKEDIKLFIEHLPLDFIKVNKKEGTIIFKKGFKEDFFKPSFDTFKALSDDITLNVFSGNNVIENGTWDNTVNRMRDILCAGYGLYIYEEGYMLLEEFIRQLDEDTTYYIGGTLVYSY